jgi:hypothetical protein
MAWAAQVVQVVAGLVQTQLPPVLVLPDKVTLVVVLTIVIIRPVVAVAVREPQVHLLAVLVVLVVLDYQNQLRVLQLTMLVVAAVLTYLALALLVD